MSFSRIRSVGATVVPALALLVVVVALYGQALGHGLVSDDFLLFAQVDGSLGQALSYHGSYHWYPLGQLVLWGQQLLAGSSGAGHHAVTLLLFWGLALATAALGRRLGLSRAAAWAGAFLLVTSVLPFEVPLWAIGSLYSVSALLALAAFCAYLRLVEAPSWFRHGAFVGLYLAALLTHEQALGVPLAAALWSLLVARERLGRVTVRLAPALGALAAYAVCKVLLTDGTALLPGVAGGSFHWLGPTVFHGFRVLFPVVPADFAWSVLRPGGLLGWLLVALIASAVAFALWCADDRERFLAAWSLSQVALMSFAVGLASRHYALALVPMVLALASLLARATANRRGWFAVGVLVLGLLGAVQLPAKVTAWWQASRVAERILDDVATLARERPSARYLLVIDLPDGLPQGESEPAYIFRLGFEDAVRGRLPGRFLDFERRRTEPRQAWVEPFGRPISSAERAALARNPEILILICPGPEAGLRRDSP